MVSGAVASLVWPAPVMVVVVMVVVVPVGQRLATLLLLLLLLGLLIPARLAQALGVSEWVVGLEECGIDVALRA